jgi:prepilin-type N-terminal cleavage/methylation domain-containing protein
LKRAGFTLVELLVAVVVAGILTTALARMLVNDSRFVARQEATLSARRTARTALNWLAVELRMVGDSGLRAAAADSITLRIPYAFGMACDRVGSEHIVSLAPSDSLAYATAAPEGLAWQRSSGDWVFVPSSGVLPSTDSTTCVADSIRTVPGGRLVGVSGLPASPPLRPVSGSISYLYQTVTYRFAASVDLPGRIALWRRVGAGAAEELAVPFDAGSGFGFLTGVSTTALNTPPADLSTVRGLEFRLIGASETTPRGASGPSTFPLVAQIQFMNRGN